MNDARRTALALLATVSLVLVGGCSSSEDEDGPVGGDGGEDTEQVDDADGPGGDEGPDDVDDADGQSNDGDEVEED